MMNESFPLPRRRAFMLPHRELRVGFKKSASR